jgi:hypothetical protein
MKALVDNDVLFKGAAYDLLEVFMTAIPELEDHVGVLGAARFVLADMIRKKRGNQSNDPALVSFMRFFESAEILEPTDEERLLAAEFEAVAQAVSVSFDTGESQLCAILIVRGLPLLLTGDKRAIIAISKMFDIHLRISEVQEKVKCLEQLVSDTLSVYTTDSIRVAICSEPAIDKALSICFGCTSAQADDQDVLAGLNSYINHLRGIAPNVLHP